MEWFTKAFVKASVAWLALAVTLGVIMAIRPQSVVYRPAHAHMNLLGFVAMMIFGVAYHVIPRFTGNPLHDRRLAGIQWWLANAGLALMVVGFFAIPHDPRGRLALVAGGVLAAVSAYAFVYNIWRTLDGHAPLRTIHERIVAKPLPLTATDH